MLIDEATAFVPMRLLLVDDDELDRMTIARALRQSGLAVDITEAFTAADGLRLAGAGHFDAILLDYSLPDQNGLELLQALRATHADRAAIIMLTRHEDDTLAAQCIDGGAQDFLLKDEVNGRRLSRAIRQAQQIHAMGEQLRASNERLRKLAEHDRLTGLANRYSFEVALHLAVARAQRKDSRIAVMLLDLDNFKNVNDTLGHDVGDLLLQAVAGRLASAVRGSDLVARLGGDEFVVLAQDLDRDAQANLLAERLLGSLQAPILAGGVELRVTTSIGVAVFEHADINTMDMMKCADIAMYRAKSDGRNQIHFYSSKLHEAVQRRSATERDLRLALGRGQFELYYQAQVAAVSRRVVGVEALLRWRHPERGLLLPGEFLAVAEEMDLMESIGAWVLHTACHQLGRWRAALPAAEPLSIAVNVSALQMGGGQLVGTVERALAESGLPGERLELEITESVLIDDPIQTAAVLDQLAQRGVQLSLDDFGTGYSSMQHLKLFPIHVLKIDRAFVCAIGQDRKDERLFDALVRFAKTLGLTVVAEGVETLEQAAFCRQVGCDRLQGYHYATPLPAGEFEHRFLAKRAVPLADAA